LERFDQFLCKAPPSSQVPSLVPSHVLQVGIHKCMATACGRNIKGGRHWSNSLSVFLLCMPPLIHPFSFVILSLSHQKRAPGPTHISLYILRCSSSRCQRRSFTLQQLRTTSSVQLEELGKHSKRLQCNTTQSTESLKLLSNSFFQITNLTLSGTHARLGPNL
jgi:hypothetical protein